MNIPGYTAEASVFGSEARDQAAFSQGHSDTGQGVFPQMRIGGGIGVGGTKLGGFWDCAICVTGCTILTGGDVVVCTVACQQSGFCD
jgi:hypothetical protein